MSVRPLYHGFLGSWVLIPQSCDYEQSEPPQGGTYCIEEVAEGLRLEMLWTDSAGQERGGCSYGLAGGEAFETPAVPVLCLLLLTAAHRRQCLGSCL
jgi:hypothetical protein